jgi:hypothetical protein
MLTPSLWPCCLAFANLLVTFTPLPASGSTDCAFPHHTEMWRTTNGEAAKQTGTHQPAFWTQGAAGLKQLAVDGS